MAKYAAAFFRLSVLFAVLDCSALVRPEHLAAALAVWQYAEDSVLCLFGDATGNPLADTILGLLRNVPACLSRTDIRKLAGKNLPEERISDALGVLLQNRLARTEARSTGGRPAEVWFACARGRSHG